MKFADYLILREQGTVGTGGPQSSGRLGENPNKPASPQTKSVDPRAKVPASSMSPGIKTPNILNKLSAAPPPAPVPPSSFAGIKNIASVPGSILSLGTKTVPNPVPASTMSPGTKTRTK